MKNEAKEKFAYCGSLFLAGLGAVSLAAAAASNAHLLTPMPSEQVATMVASLCAISSSFSAVGLKLTEKLNKKHNALKKVQKALLTVSFCGFAAIAGADDFIATRDYIERGKKIDQQKSSLIMKEMPRLPNMDGFVYNDKPLTDYRQIPSLMECARDYKLEQHPSIALAAATKLGQEIQ